MKVHVDQNRCQGHGLCAMSLDAVFEFDDDTGRATVDESGVKPEYEVPIRAAEAMCPEGAITVEWTG